MIAVATIVGAILAAMICRVGHGLGARNESATNVLRITGGTLLFAMAGSAASEGMWLGVLAATLSAGFVALGGIDILRGETREPLAIVPPMSDIEQVRDGDTREMPIIIRDVA